MEKTFILGIDPSFKTMGACIYNIATHELKFGGGDLFETIKFIRENADQKRTIAVVENPDLDNTVFNAAGPISKSINELLYQKSNPFKKVKDRPTVNSIVSDVRIALKIAQGVGKNKAAAQLIIQVLERAGIPVLQIAPSKRMRADKDLKKLKADPAAGVKLLSMPTKTTSHQFKQLTGYAGRTNEHQRDACTLFWGKSINNLQILIAGQKQD